MCTLSECFTARCITELRPEIKEILHHFVLGFRPLECIKYLYTDLLALSKYISDCRSIERTLENKKDFGKEYIIVQEQIKCSNALIKIILSTNSYNRNISKDIECDKYYKGIIKNIESSINKLKSDLKISMCTKDTIIELIEVLKHCNNLEEKPLNIEYYNKRVNDFEHELESV